MNQLSRNIDRECWRETLPDDAVLAHDLERLEKALQGLNSLNRLLASNHTESQEEDKANSEALDANLTGGLHAAAAALANYAYGHIGELQRRLKARNG